MDQFISIANIKTEKREDLSERVPDVHEEKILPLKKSGDKLALRREISEIGKLNALLDKTRRRYAPFLSDLHPVNAGSANKIEIKDFIANGKPITIPDYGGPVGSAEKVYETSVTIDKKEGKHYRIYFQSVDYIAFVYVNGECVGTHEGFFAPFWFDITRQLKNGDNRLKIVVKNDFPYLGYELEFGEKSVEGDKLYACTGPGWDDPYLGWHHCPPGFGIIGKVFVEECDDLIINDVFVRILPDYSSEAWIEVYSFTYEEKAIDLSLSVYGKNFDAVVVENLKYDGGAKKIKNRHNLFKIPFRIENPRLWNNESPWLYKAVVTLQGDNAACVKERHFGVRTFSQDVENEPKGAFYLNGERIKLRGANTMGFEQQDVMKGDFNRLIDDILLAKICNMNFWRITQRPVQEEVYDYCDMLGLMVQTDLPLFGVMRKTKFAEGVRQAEEMERLVRSHPSCVVDSFINEPFKEARGGLHRHMSRSELEIFFSACKGVINITNPERVVKSVDGDYDPPSEDFPDNHCYLLWYNNHELLFGKFNKGYWQPIKKGWYYGCGEFGSEGLDTEELMRRRYPAEWIKAPFDPDNIFRAQTGKNYCVFYPKQQTMQEWIDASREYQAFVTKTMTEFFRRDRLCASFAIHLFIDAFPDGWLKAIVDCERKPKPAYFAYRNALKPVIVSLRGDRLTCFAEETVKVEAFLCNDLNRETVGTLRYSVEDSEGNTVFSGVCEAHAPAFEPVYTGTIAFTAQKPKNGREKYLVKAEYVDNENVEIFSSNTFAIEVFDKIDYTKDDNLEIIELKNIGESNVNGHSVRAFDMYAGGVYFVEVPQNDIFGNLLKKDDLRFLYNAKTDMIDYTADCAFTSEGFVPLIVKPSYSGVDFGREEIVSYRKDGEKITVLTSINLREENPSIKLFIKALNENLRKAIEKRRRSNE